MTATRNDPCDGYAAAAAAYDLFNVPFRAAQVKALDRLVPLLQPDQGPVLDVGAGSGLNTAWLLDRLPAVTVLAIEPSPAMRALALARLIERPEWHRRATVRPEDFFAASLPRMIGGAVLLGVLGHFDPGERAAVLAELARRLPMGGAALIDLQPPWRPEPVAAHEFTAGRIGDLEYRGIAQAEPVGGEALLWTITYLVLESERVLDEATTTQLYHHPDLDQLDHELSNVGLRREPVGCNFHLLVRAGDAAG